MNEDNYILELAPDEHYLLIQALVLLSDTCTTFCKDQDPLIDKIRMEITHAWAKRFQKEDINNIKELLQPEQEQEPVTDKPTETAIAVMPNGVCVSNVYDAYEEGRKSVMSEQEPVAWMYEWVDEVGEPVKSVVYNFYEGANLIPLYTAIGVDDE